MERRKRIGQDHARFVAIEPAECGLNLEYIVPMDTVFPPKETNPQTLFVGGDFAEIVGSQDNANAPKQGDDEPGAPVAH